MNNLFQGQKTQTLEGGLAQTNPFKETVNRITNQGQIDDKLENIERAKTLNDFNMERSFQNMQINQQPILLQHQSQNQIIIDQQPISMTKISPNIYTNTANNITNNNTQIGNINQMQYNQEGGYMPMNQIHPLLLELNKQLEQDMQNQNTEKTEEKITDDPQKDGEILQDIIDVMKNQGDERHQNSEFLKFIERMKTGDIKLNEKDNTIDDVNDPKLVARDSDKYDEKKLEEIWGRIEKDMNFGGLGDDYLGQDIQAPPKESLFQKNNPYLMMTDQNKNSDLVEISQSYLDKGDIDQAKFALEAEVQNNPDNAEAWLNLGRIHTENDRDDFAMQCFLKALEADPFNADALLALGISCTNEFDEFDAMVYLRDWIRRHHIYNKYFDSNNPILESELIRKEMNIDRDDEDYYTKAVRIDGLKQNFYREMCNLMENISKNESPDTDLWIALGIAHFIPHDNERAIECFRRAVEINPKDYNAWNKLGAILAHSKMNEEAILTYKKALDLKPNYPRCSANLGIALFNVDNYNESMRSFLRALKTYKEIPHVWTYMSSLAMSMNNKELYNLVNERNLGELLKIYSL